MMRLSRGIRVVAALAVVALPVVARGEDLQQAWGIALGVNQGLQSQQQSSVAAAFTVKASESARYVSVRSYNIDTFLAASPKSKGGSGLAGSGSNGGSSSASAMGAASIFVLGPNQTFLPISLTTASIPLYTGGKLVKTVESNRALLNAQKTEEVRTAIDLKLTVAEAYIGVLRARRNLETARSNVEQLTSFARDVKNRLDQGLAIRSDELAAEVSLANAQLNELTARSSLESAFATYNRYVCRPLDAMADLEEITAIPANADWKGMADQAVRTRREFIGANNDEVRELSDRAVRGRPELAGLAQQAKSQSAQAEATRAALRPQVTLNGGFLFLGAENFAPQGNGNLSLIIDWTFTDSGKTRRQAAALQAQERSTLKRRSDNAADVALQVRTRWLDLQTSRQRVPIARFAVVQADENVRVITDRYRQQLSTYTEVLDAENRRVQSLNSFYNAVYDENLAFFRLRRAVGDI